MKLKLEIINLEGQYLSKEVDFVNVVTIAGELTILANHLPLITTLKISHLYFSIDDEVTYFAIAGGTLFVSEDGCKIITSAIEKEDEIDFDRAQNAKNRALDRINAHNNNESIDIKRAELALLRAVNRLSFKEK